MCNETEGCILCSSGFYLSSSSCVSCRESMVGCAECDSSNICLLCDWGYIMNSSNNSCNQCSAFVEGCLICNPNNGTCTGCMSGFYLSTANPPTCNRCS
jgi:hypothetical protein